LIKTILIDANAIGRASHAATKLTVGTFQTQAIYGFIRTVSALARENPRSPILTLWDGKPDHRFAMLPTYKEKRTTALVDPEKAADRAAYHAQVPYIKKMIASLGIPQMLNSALEADDLAGYLVPILSATGEVELITGDSDWLCLVNERCSWFDPRKDGQKINHLDFFEKTGYFSPREYIEGKALIGDTTDDIPPAGGIGGKGAPEFMAQFRSMQAFRDQCDAGAFVPTSKAHRQMWKGTSEFSKEQWAARYVKLVGLDEKKAKKHLKDYLEAWPGQSRSNWDRNIKLMDLLDQPKPDPAKTTLTHGELNETVYRTLCERLVFNSIIREWDQNMKPFRDRWQARLARAA
jgi:5'-3' exonuclease